MPNHPHHKPELMKTDRCCRKCKKPLSVGRYFNCKNCVPENFQPEWHGHTVYATDTLDGGPMFNRNHTPARGIR